MCNGLWARSLCCNDPNCWHQRFISWACLVFLQVREAAHLLGFEKKLLVSSQKRIEK